MRIIGLDLSLTATGVAIIDDGTAATVAQTTVHTFVSKGAKDATIAQRVARLDQIERAVFGFTGLGDSFADLIVIEGPSYAQRTQTGEHLRAGLWWRLVSFIEGECGPVAEVPPTVLKKYATGKGNAGKDEVLLAVARRFPDVEVRDNNQADALVLAAMGADHLGHPIATMPASHRAALDAVRWHEAVAS